MLRVFISPSTRLRIEEINELVAIKISPSQFHQIVLNLCVNASHAIDANQAGTITISLQERQYTEGQTVFDGDIASGHYVCLQVSDTGCGIPEEVLPHIFEPFFSTKDVGKGTGMGLSVVYGIVKKAGGGIAVESTLGKGSRFSVYFPLYKDDNRKTGTEA
jgi:two-component system cell cycle sensor histidine kinase/response regulator CckA